jgi:hypothetical protein
MNEVDDAPLLPPWDCSTKQTAQYFRMIPLVATDPFTIPFTPGDHHAPRLCADPSCCKRLSRLNKEDMCFSCHERRVLKAIRRK